MGVLSGKPGLLLWVSGGVILLDQGTKWAVKTWLTPHESVEVIPGLFHLTYTFNPGAAFGLFAGAPEYLRIAFLIGVSVAALAVLGLLFARVPAQRWYVLLALALVMGGAMGNLIDRIHLKQVVDFFDFFWRDYHWYTFNVADSAITVGALSLMAMSLFSKQGDLFSKEG